MGLDSRRVMVTGAGGFVGPNLVRRFASEGASVTAMVRAGSELRRLETLRDPIQVASADLLDFDSVRRVLREQRPDAVIHAAAGGYHPRTVSSRLASVAVPTMGTAHLLEAALECGVARLLFLGSPTVYRRGSRR